MNEATPEYKQRLGEWARDLRDRTPRKSWNAAARMTALILGDGSDLGAESLRKWAEGDFKEFLADATIAKIAIVRGETIAQTRTWLYGKAESITDEQISSIATLEEWDQLMTKLHDRRRALIPDRAVFCAYLLKHWGEIAAMAKLDPVRVKAIAQGQEPTGSELINLANAFGGDADWLITLFATKQPTPKRGVHQRTKTQSD